MLALAIAPEIQSALVKVALPIFAIGIVLFLARARRLSFPEVLGFRPAPWRSSLLWIALAAGWMLLSNALWHWRGPWEFGPWRQAPLLASILRVLAVGILGPMAEELIFRGLLYGRLATTRVGPVATIVILALFWAVIHVSYNATVITVIFIDGLLLGAARWHTGSLLPPVLMHLSGISTPSGEQRPQITSAGV